MSLTDSAKRNWDRAVKLKEAIGVIIFYFTFIYTPANPDIEVIYSEVDYLAEPPKESKESHLNSLITIRLANKADRDIEDVELIINDVINISSIYGRASINSFNEEMSELVNYTRKEDQIVFKKLKRIPSGHNIQIQMHGNFYHNILSNRIDFFANSNKIKFTKEYLSTGFSYHIDKYKHVYFSLLIILLIWIGFKRFERGGDQ